MPLQDRSDPTGRRRRTLLLLLAAVAGLHGALLQGLSGQAPRTLPGWPARALPVLVQRTVTPSAERVAEAAPAPAPPPQPPAAPRPSPRPAAAPALPSAAVPALPAAAEPPPAETASPNAGDDAEPALAGDQPPPLYAAAPPGPALLHYQLQRGALSGVARLTWQPQGERYEMAFDARAGNGRSLIEQRSRGGLDASGLAPERFVDRRRARAAQAANFQRDRGRITFSGPPVEHPAWPGAQDRLGWIAQLAAIQSAAAEPLPEVTLFVVGARGGAGLWTFRTLGREPVATPFGSFEALHYERRPASADDLQVEVWLDPARGFWPLRLRWVPARGGEALELLLAAEPSVP